MSSPIMIVSSRFLDSTSIPLGIDADVQVPCGPHIDLEPGHVVAFFTDGVVEADSGACGRFGTDRALELIKTHRDRPAAEIVDMLYRAVVDFCGRTALEDDLTAVIVKALPR
jgi:serine phosphatase RsbU (regulator of sigma subunit)